VSEESEITKEDAALGGREARGPPAADRAAKGLRGFGPPGIAAIFVILGVNLLGTPLGGVGVLLWAWVSRTRWKDIGYVRPRSWANTVVVGLFCGVTLRLLMKVLVMPLLDGPGRHQANHDLAGNATALPGLVFAVVFSSGFREETFFRGYLFERLGRLLGHHRGAQAAIVAISAGLFGLAHYADQGVAGVEQSVITGLFFGAMFAATAQIWMVMITHIAFNLTAIAIVYSGMDSDLAQLVFHRR
jgi:membrane protease YdiL (CAAX protease family)